MEFFKNKSSKLLYKRCPCFVYLLVLVTFLIGCKKEETKLARTPFWEILEGNWKFDSTYLINGQPLQINGFELDNTTLRFNITGLFGTNFKNEWEYSDGNCGMILLNKNGLALGNSGSLKIYISELAELMLFYAYSRCSEYEEIISNPDGYRNNFTELSYQALFAVSKADCSQLTTSQEVSDCTTKYKQFAQLEDFEYFKIFHSQHNEYFKIVEKSASELELHFYMFYYKRIINGEEQLDEIVFRIKRINESEILNIPPFHPNNYSYSWWHSLGWTQNGLTVHGGASFDDEGIDGKCLHIDGTGQYAEFDHKPYAPMTMSFWIKPETVSRPKQVLYSKYKNQYGPFIFSLEQDKFVMEINDGFGNLQKVSSGLSIPADEWTHICLTVTPDNLATLYLNGEPDSQGTINSFNYDADALILFGTAEEALNQGLDVNYRGYIDEIIFFNKVFSKGEVRQLLRWHLTN